MEDDQGQTQNSPAPMTSSTVGEGGDDDGRAGKVEEGPGERSQVRGEEDQEPDEVEGRRRLDRLSCEERNAEWLSNIAEIQEAGYVLVLKEDGGADRSGLRLAGVSANVTGSEWWRHERSAEDLIGSDIMSVFNHHCANGLVALIRRRKANLDPSARDRDNLVSVDFCPFPVDNDHELLTCSVASSNPGVYLLEVERKDGLQSASPESAPGLIQVAQVMECFTPGASPEVLTGAVCDSLMQSLPAYDRVMMYRFASDKSGEVIHEAIRPGSEVSSSYLNLRFPAADIPDSARRLLLLNRTRVICDTHMQGAALRVHLGFKSAEEAGEGDEEKLDLSMSTLRAPARCHLRYLQNMGVRASMAAAITVDNELWGMFSFHSYTRVVTPTVEERTLVEVAARVTGMTLARNGRETAATNSLTLTNILGRLSKHARVQNFLSAEHRSLLRILDVDTIVLCEQWRSTSVYGNSELSLSPTECKEMLQDDLLGRTLSFRSESGRGIAFFSVRSFLVAFVRGSVAQRVVWAGQPDPPVIDHEGDHPRASFERFVASASAQVPPWSRTTVELLGIVRHSVAAHLYEEALPADLEEIFAHVSHELRTPFHGVMGSLEMLDEGLHTMGVEERQNVIRSAIACGNGMLTTLGDILDIAKDRNNTELSNKWFAASSPIQQAMSAMNQFGAQKSLELITNIDPAVGALTVVGDERRIKHIVQNLVNNAIKFTPMGGKVWSSLLMFEELEEVQAWWSEQSARFENQCWKGIRDDQEGEEEKKEGAREATTSSAASGGVADTQTRWFVYSVEDTGVGVSRGDLLLLTLAYRQISHGASKAYAGTGLGLHISNVHIRTMSGSLGIASTCSEKGESTTNPGTIFACVLPLRVAKPAPGGSGAAGGGAAARGEGAADPAENRGALISRKVTFLVADDHGVNVKLLQHKILKAFDKGSEVQVVSAMDGEMALKKWEVARRAAKEDGSIVAGVFMDFHMPDMDGMECTSRIRCLEAERGWSRTPISGCTADPTDRTRKSFDRAGGDEVLFKPWLPGQVESMCRRMVARALEAEKGGEKGSASTG
eukprot:g8474.t1